jgi:multiple sugar transport system permease protein
MKRSLWKTILIYLGIAVTLSIFLFPVYWMVVSSFRHNSQLMSFPPRFSLNLENLENYTRIINTAKYMKFFKNSLITSAGTVVCSMVVSLLASFAFSRYKFMFKNALMTALMNVQVFPTTVIIISLFTFYSTFGLLNTYRGLILADLVYSLPFTVWFLKAFMDTVPKSLDEAAQIDGCSRIQVLTKIIMPIVRPGMIAIGIYTFLYTWDDFVFAQIIMKDEAMRTLPIGMAQSFIGEYLYDYASMMTLSVFASLPVVAAFMFAGRYMVEGLTAGAVKG